MIAAEQERAEAHRAAVLAWAHRLPSVLASPDAARDLALDVVDALVYMLRLDVLQGTLEDAFRAKRGQRSFTDVRAAANLLASSLFARGGARWTWETREPYEVAELLKMACEDEALLCYGAAPWCRRCASCSCGRLANGAPCDVCDGTTPEPWEPVSPPLLALLLHDAHALLSDVRADTAGLERLVQEAEAREREKPTARPVRHTNEARPRWSRESEER